MSSEVQWSEVMFSGTECQWDHLYMVRVMAYGCSLGAMTDHCHDALHFKLITYGICALVKLVGSPG